MELLDSSGTRAETALRRLIWDLTYACPLRCIHCYSESGRRAARTLNREDMLRVVKLILAVKPERISFAGGEPILAPWWDEAADLLNSGGVPVSIFLSGWRMDEDIANRLATSVSAASVSVDGPDSRVHDNIRGRAGSFDRAMTALDLLDRVKRERETRGASCYRLGIDYTVTRGGQKDIGNLVEEASARFPGLDYVRIGAAVPVGLAEETSFVESELLTDDELQALVDSEAELVSRAKNGVEVSVTDVRSFLPNSPLAAEGATTGQIEPDGAFRAFAIYEAKVGNILDEPIEVLWKRALEWRNEPFVLDQLNSVHNLTDWARAARALDRRYGSEADKARIARRNAAV